MRIQTFCQSEKDVQCQDEGQQGSSTLLDKSAYEQEYIIVISSQDVHVRQCLVKFVIQSTSTSQVVQHTKSQTVTINELWLVLCWHPRLHRNGCCIVHIQLASMELHCSFTPH